jgi:zinc transport system ATP-binding protein
VTDAAAFAIRRGRVIRDGRLVLRDVDFELRQDAFTALLGPNGAGKSTLVNALLGLLPLARGEVEIFGKQLREFRDWGRIGYVPQRPASAPGVPATALEIAMLGRLARTRRLRGWTKRDREVAMHALATVGLADHADRPAANLSGGQQQRLRVARALTGEPDVLVLDEPFVWVDVQTELDLVTTLGDFRARQGTVLFVAHDLHAVGDVVERVVVIEDGAIVADGPRADVDVRVAEHAHEHEPPEVRGLPQERRRP